MNTLNEIQALQNWADKFGLTVTEHYQLDKRRTTKLYFLTDGTLSVSPTLDYENMNCFLNGWGHCLKHLPTPPAEKSLECKRVLQLMDKDYSYSEALDTACTFYDIQDRAALEKELEKYV